MRTKHKNWREKKNNAAIRWYDYGAKENCSVCAVFVDDNFCLISVIDRECVLFYQI